MQPTSNSSEIRVQDVRRNDPSVIDTIERIYSIAGIKIKVDPSRTYLGTAITRYTYVVNSNSSGFSEKSKRRAEVQENLRNYFAVMGIRFDFGWLEVPAKNPVPPKIADLLATETWKKAAADPTYIPLLLGLSSSGNPVVATLGATGPGGYHAHMLIGGMGGSGKSELIATILTALHTCRTPQQLRIVLLYPHSDYFAFAKSPLMSGLIKNISIHRDAVSFMNEMVSYVRKRRSDKSEEELYRDEPNVLFIIDNYESYQIGDSHKDEFKQLVEDCTSLGRGGHIHLLIVSAFAASKKISHGNISGNLSFYNDRDGSRFVIGTPEAANLSRVGDLLYESRSQEWVRVAIPLASRAEQDLSVDFCVSRMGFANGDEASGIKLAEHYLNGSVVPHDHDTAMKIYREMSDRGSKMAKERLSDMESTSASRKWYLRANDETFGPVSDEQFVQWAKEGRVQPGQTASTDGSNWQRVEQIPLLGMHFSIDVGDDRLRGPLTREAAERLLNSGKLPPGSKIIDTSEDLEDEDLKCDPVVTANDRVFRQALIRVLAAGDEGVDAKTLPGVVDAADAGDSDAQFLLGLTYEQGTAGEQDYAKARQWYEKSALNNNPKATLAVGRFFEEGLGEEAHAGTAYEWYRYALEDQGYEGARTAYERMKKQLEAEKPKIPDNPPQKKETVQSQKSGIRRVAIVGVEGSGKTVMLAGLGDLYSHPDENGFFLSPQDFGTCAYVNRQIAVMRSGHWPKATVGDELKGLNWLLRRRSKDGRPVDVCEVSFLDFAGEVYRAAFGIDQSDGAAQYADQVAKLKAYLSEVDDLVVLINLKDVIAYGLMDRRTEEAMWISNSILEYALNDKDGRKMPRAAIVLSQADNYAETIKRFGGASGALSEYVPHLANVYSWLDILEASAVDKTDIDDEGRLVPNSQFRSTGLYPVMRWILRGVAPDVVQDETQTEKVVEEETVRQETPPSGDQKTGEEGVFLCAVKRIKDLFKGR